MEYGILGSTGNVGLGVKRKVFVSYHHGGDQYYYNEFSRVFSGNYEVVSDNSLDRRVQSEDCDYVRRRIRENYIKGSSCTIVLCGQGTSLRKYVDWEIMATLDKGHGLIGIKLPTLPIVDNGCAKPPRLQDNIDSGYAVWGLWENIIGDPGRLASQIELARSKSARLIDNGRNRRLRNG